MKILVVAAFLVATGSSLLAGSEAGRQLYEPESAASERCAAVGAKDSTGSPEWHECHEREMTKSALDAALPWLALSSGGVVVGLGGLVLGRKDIRPRTPIASRRRPWARPRGR